MKSNERKIEANGQTLNYNLRRRRGARHLRLTVRCDATVVLTMPRFIPIWQGESFLKQKINWIISKVEEIKNNINYIGHLQSHKHYAENKKQARILILNRLEEINKHYNFVYKKISIRNQKSRWGSCSKQGNINFNYRLLFLPDNLRDYVVAHELCHLKQHNHSAAFWDLLEQAVPDYKLRRRDLKKIRS